MEVAKRAKTEGQVGETVNRERKKKRNINEGIELEESMGYFKDLLGGVEGRVIRGMR